MGTRPAIFIPVFCRDWNGLVSTRRTDRDIWPVSIIMLPLLRMHMIMEPARHTCFVFFWADTYLLCFARRLEWNGWDVRVHAGVAIYYVCTLLPTWLKFARLDTSTPDLSSATQKSSSTRLEGKREPQAYRSQLVPCWLVTHPSNATCPLRSLLVVRTLDQLVYINTI
jgi:hypothetical protein